MALAIGFSTKYYTLWDVCTETLYTGNDTVGYLPYQITKYVYIQNLAKDENKAIEKAIEKGCTDLKPNNELYGRNKSFNSQQKLYSELPRNLSPFFEFGKYKDKLIYQCTDIEYIKWYYDQTNNRYSKTILIQSETFKYSDEYGLITSERYEKLMKRKNAMKDVISTDSIEFTCTKNLDQYGYINVEYNNANIQIVFPYHKIQEYNGYNYALPVDSNGKAKRIKGKKIRAKIVEGKDYNNETVMQVENFEILKG